MPVSACPTVRPHDHAFGQGAHRPEERRTLAITLLTLAVMVVEIAAGWLTGSMALLADGVHMGTHALALGLAAAAYGFARRHATDRRFSFGTGKAGDLAGFTSALMLGLSAVLLAGESVARLFSPHGIAYGDAMVVAAIGLVVNLVSAVVLAGHGHNHGHGHDHDHAHDHAHGPDNNLRAALFHVLADAVTSVAALAALGLAWVLGWNWLDPVVALVASGVILVWAWGLLRDTARVLLDVQAPAAAREAVRAALERDGETIVTDLHLWSVGAQAVTLVASVVTHGRNEPDDYAAALPSGLAIRHPVIEVRHCTACGKIGGVVLSASGSAPEAG